MKALDVKERIILLNGILDQTYIIESGKWFDSSISSFRNVLEKDPCKSEEFTRLLGGKLTYLGGGIHGRVYGIEDIKKTCIDDKSCKNSIVFKISDYRDDASIDNPYYNNNAEVNILYSLQPLLLQGNTPHIPIIAADFICTQEGIKSRYIVTERADMDLKGFVEAIMKDTDDKKRNTVKPVPINIIRLILFQILWTLNTIQKRYPGFRHNDVHAKNILIFKYKDTGYTQYISRDQVYYVPNMGIEAVLWDFGYSNISAVSLKDIDDNIPNLSCYISRNNSVGFTPNHYIDIVKLLLYLWWVLIPQKMFSDTDPLYDKFISFIKGNLPQEYIEQEDLFESFRPIIDYEYTTPKEMLKNPFFDDFKIVQKNIMDTYEEFSYKDIPLYRSEYTGETIDKKLPIFRYKYNPTCKSFRAMYLNPRDGRAVRYNRDKCQIVTETVDKIDKNVMSQVDIMVSNYLKPLKDKKDILDIILDVNAKILDTVLTLSYVPLAYLQEIVLISLNLSCLYILGFYMIPPIAYPDEIEDESVVKDLSLQIDDILTRSHLKPKLLLRRLPMREIMKLLNPRLLRGLKL